MNTAYPFTASALYTELRRRLPRWVFANVTTSPVIQQQIPLLGDGMLLGELPPEPPELDVVYGTLCLAFEDFYHWFDELYAMMYIDEAHTDFLDMHATDRGHHRFEGEADPPLRYRLRHSPDCVTCKALHAAAVEVLGCDDDQVTVNTLRDEFMFYRRTAWGGGDRTRWGTSIYENENNPFSVALAVVPRIEISVNTAWSREFAWRRSHWGGIELDHKKYKRLRQTLEERKAAGTTILIYLQGDT